MSIAITQESRAKAFVLTTVLNGTAVGEARLYLIYNQFHDQPYGLLEYVEINEAHRGKGLGKELVLAVIEKAKVEGCYKLIGQSRFGKERVHEMYEKIGFEKHGYNFRMDF